MIEAVGSFLGILVGGVFIIVAIAILLGGS